MDLLIDWGNTQLKAVLIEDWNGSQFSQDNLITCDGVSSLLKHLSFKSIDSLGNVLISSVQTEERNQQLVSSLNQLTNNLYFAKTHSESCGVSCAYLEPEFLGVDRWLAVIAAHEIMLKDLDSKEGQKLVIGVISIGTAITLDLVTKNQHLGGHILPGQRLMFESLHQTGQVRPNAFSADKDKLTLGRSTSECVENGIKGVIEGYLKLAMEELGRQYSVSHWFIHGGGGKDWFEKLQASFPKLEHKPLLIFDGLKLLHQEQDR